MLGVHAAYQVQGRYGTVPQVVVEVLGLMPEIPLLNAAQTEAVLQDARHKAISVKIETEEYGVLEISFPRGQFRFEVTQPPLTFDMRAPELFTRDQEMVLSVRPYQRSGTPVCTVKQVRDGD